MLEVAVANVFLFLGRCWRYEDNNLWVLRIILLLSLVKSRKECWDQRFEKGRRILVRLLR
jgi:hypothetical protein